MYALKMYFKNSKRHKEREHNQIKNKSLAIDSVKHIIQKNTPTANTDSSLELTQKLEKECNDTISYRAVKILTQDIKGNLLIGKQIASNMFLYIYIKNKFNIDEKKLYISQLDSTGFSEKVIVINTGNKKEQLHLLTNKIINNTYSEYESYQCMSGKIFIYSFGNEHRELSIMLKDLKLKNKKNSELFFDEMLICFDKVK
jgi:hypothetical protein